MMLITLSGTDGSGKSTQLSLLRDAFEKDGRKVVHFHSLEFSIGNRIVRRLKNQKDFMPGSEKANVKSTPFSVFLRSASLLTDVIVFRIHLSSLKRNGTDVFLSDRYFYDTIVNILFLSGTGRAGIILRLAERLVVRPDFAFFLDVSPETVMRREQPPEQGIEYLRSKQSLFRSKQNAWNLIPLDANGTRDDVRARILAIIGK